ncbi:hypothetical protein [Kitasatospora sp. NPDC101183]|uniref:hypothetical protein n=1 Tax=Kitasatospora sp. NPDC101183 TaxID=3364100 RepID=UPI00382D40FA
MALTITSAPSTGGYGATVTLTGLTTGSRDRWSLWRTTPDGVQTPVRGYGGDLIGVTATGDVTVTDDYEAPLGRPVAYYVRVWTSATPGSWIDATASWLTLAHPDALSVVLKDPSIPSRTTTVVVTTMPSWQRAARQAVHQVRGRPRPVVLTDVRSARTGSVVLSTATHTERQALTWLLESGHTLLAQWPPGWGEDDTYLQVGSVGEDRLSEYAPQPDRGWTLELTEVDRPIGGLVGSAGRTWQTVRDGNATWANLLTKYSTWLGVLTGVEGT